CTLFYAFMPKAKVQWRAALVGGLVAGVLWLLNNELSVYSVTQISRGGNGGVGGINQNRAIYRSLVAGPVFMVGLYFFWALLLFGAQVSYTFQHRRSFLMARQAERVHQAGREFVALRIMIEAGRAFCTGAPPPTVDSLAERLEVPGQLITRAT